MMWRNVQYMPALIYADMNEGTHLKLARVSKLGPYNLVMWIRNGLFQIQLRSFEVPDLRLDPIHII